MMPLQIYCDYLEDKGIDSRLLRIEDNGITVTNPNISDINKYGVCFEQDIESGYDIQYDFENYYGLQDGDGLGDGNFFGTHYGDGFGVACLDDSIVERAHLGDGYGYSVSKYEEFTTSDLL